MKQYKTKSIFSLSLIFIVFLTILPYPQMARQKAAKGIVFEDTDNNGLLDKGEKGIPGVVVSNQCEVVRTDENGRFHLPVSKETIIFVTKPAGYDLPVDKNNFPRFYYIHQPKGSPSGLKYKGISPTGKLPRLLHFPLIKSKKTETFNVIVCGDPQTRTTEEIDYFRDDVVTYMLGIDAVFYLALGDIMYDNLDLYDNMIRLAGQIGLPIHHVLGNHDMNYRVSDYRYQAETFKRIHGPDYYSFNYGSVHFVVLNTIQYKGWNKKENKPGAYTGNIHERQLTWLKNDLAFVPEEDLVVLTMHIPIESPLYKDSYNKITNSESLFKILENRKHLLALAGHMHYFEYHELNESSTWKGSNRFPSIIAGAACGTWWHGPHMPNGIPLGMCTDGTPNGFFVFHFTGNRYRYDFYPCGPVENQQLRINSPIGSLSQEDLNHSEINVNVYTGTSHTKVSYQLDGGTPIVMERKVMDDPFFTQLVKENKGSYKKWMKPSLSAHIWTAPLPRNLPAGIHRLIITVKNRQGDTFTAYRLFEILKNPKNPKNS